MENRPHILVLHVDQLRWDCLGCMGNPDVKTPHLDALAQEGIRYCNHHTVYPICTPSRYSLWSGMYVHQHGAWTNRATLPTGYATFPRLLSENGYDTAAVGKMHFTPTYQDVGFSRMTLAEQNGIGRYEDDYHRELMEKGLIDRVDLQDQAGEMGLPVDRENPMTRLGCLESDLSNEDHSTAWVTRKALEEIDGWDEKTPRMLMVGYVKPHHPFDPPKKYSGLYDPDKLTLLPGYTDHPFDRDNATNGLPLDYNSLTEKEIRQVMAYYYATITAIDDGVGEIVERLRKKGLYDRTLIVFTSDHGEYLGYHHMLLKCNHLYEPLARIPLLIKLPGSEKAGTTDDRLCENIDLAPTLLHAAGIQAVSSMNGLDLMQDEPRDYVFSEGQFGSDEAPCLGYMLKTRRYKLLLRGSFTENGLLFDLEKDPAEMENCFGSPAYAAIQHELVMKLCQHLLFNAGGKNHRDEKAPQLRSPFLLQSQKEAMQAFIREKW